MSLKAVLIRIKNYLSDVNCIKFYLLFFHQCYLNLNSDEPGMVNVFMVEDTLYSGSFERKRKKGKTRTIRRGRSVREGVQTNIEYPYRAGD